MTVMTEHAHHDIVKVLDCPSAARHILVIGGGTVAARRVDALSRSCYAVTVVADRLCDDMFDLLAEKRITWENRSPRPSDLDGVWLLHAASDDAAIDFLVCGWVEQRRRARALSVENVGLDQPAGP